MRELFVDLKDFKEEHLRLAITRLSYLYPKLNFEKKNNSIFVKGLIEDEENIKKEVSYCVYREKIYSENLEIRKKIFEEI
ncbi:hypothetical protein PQY77_03730 [Candidatus Pelagibacter sp.]|nr:hypothetical protein [Candidatus Pelagibacter sp.]